jgi:hypothetical protein
MLGKIRYKTGEKEKHMHFLGNYHQYDLYWHKKKEMVCSYDADHEGVICQPWLVKKTTMKDPSYQLKVARDLSIKFKLYKEDGKEGN